jgi:hypothetical protein
VVLHLNKSEELIPIGIASSVTSSSGYNWKKTIEIAKQFDISILQFHINQFDSKFEWQKNQSKFKQIYLHLPPEFDYLHPSILPIKKLKTFPILIQHERYLQKKDIAFFIEMNLPLGFENDQANELNTYFNSLKSLLAKRLNLTSVIDFPRFFHQFHEKYSEELIYNQIINVLKWCKDNQVPVILHAIDIANYNPARSNWVPIFRGILPWTKFLTFILEESIPVKSLIFEYEDIINTEKSVYSLREWFSSIQYSPKNTE